MAWTYDSALRRDTVTAKNGGTTQQTATYQYDTAGRVWKVSDSSYVATYPNIEVKSLYGATQAETNEVFVAAATESPMHDVDGNLTQDGRWTYTWDGENRLVQMIRDTASPTGARQKLAFEYDHQGRGIRKTFFTRSGSNWVEQRDTICLYEGWNVVAELNATNNTLIRSYTWGTDLSGSVQSAGGVGGLLHVGYHVGTVTNAFVAYDGNGNVAGLVRASDGTTVARYDYGPFAEPLRATGPMAAANPMRFSTKYHDGESGFLYYGYRYYDPSTGRWISRDPIGEEGGRNLFFLAFNNLLDKFDLDGRDTWCPYPYPGHYCSDPKPPVSNPSRERGYVPPPGRFAWDGVCPLTCCNEDKRKKGLDDLGNKYREAVSAATARGLTPAGPYDRKNAASCKNTSQDIINWLMPTPPCWRCYLEQRDYVANDFNDRRRDHQVIICVSFGVLGNATGEVMFDWWGDAKGRNEGGFEPHDPSGTRHDIPYYAPYQATSPDIYADCQGMIHGKVPVHDFSSSTSTLR